MKVNVIATGSAGNLYEILDRDGNSIVLESGMPRQTFIRYREGIRPPEMCIVSHRHGDHFKNFGEYQAVMPAYLHPEKAESKSFKAMGFSMLHGGEVCYSYIIKSLVENKMLFFGTDFEYSDEYVSLFDALKFYEVENYLIECNYNNYLYHLADSEQRRGCDRHMSDDDVIRFIRRAGAKAPKIITVHGSNRLSADMYTKKYLSSRLISSSVSVAIGAKEKTKNIFII